ncbi:3-hydroxyacyl-ACP dehydratase FabZ [Desulfovibrio fairfieldensis]|uniref:3-hydroxyacyl-[acyl-carrier-protein] dehydratase FabZ n=1 Tax=Desulfovibrio fairfieldensis TaxID=44742 RepID=A0A0X8JKI8_9BACT|nr:3-hydroxyacyl-ACP dehydratase FabZ [Desulfovibrio fairfieldensis]AMD90458.1 3-hydroxyacyl-[acyl-carrier-protein] dehydratase FabZ [Desulfovibrio fairfieldensis]GKG94710.1 3-hydroxyacyl-[acyl-carrier-protein] dehydratase FabZ [Desulfovibrionaceae bacterium]GKI13262.1 3-hydroxyacyl-[acyl-carrier-protein] dehydratase FabZ [Desulfovibrionaceae bacterium]
MQDTVTQSQAMDIQRILSILPHRYPFLLVDRVVECVPGSHIKAYKNVSVNEPFFQGHFPGVPIMPGVLILEALAQTGGLLAAAGMGDLADKLFLFTGLDGVKFRRQVVPGDRLDLECSNMRMKLKLCKMEARAFVDGKLAAEARITAAIGDRPGA